MALVCTIRPLFMWTEGMPFSRLHMLDCCEGKSGARGEYQIRASRLGNRGLTCASITLFPSSVLQPSLDSNSAHATSQRPSCSVRRAHARHARQFLPDRRSRKLQWLRFLENEEPVHRVSIGLTCESNIGDPYILVQSVLLWFIH